MLRVIKFKKALILNGMGMSLNYDMINLAIH